MATDNQKGFIGRKALLLMSLTFSFITFCLLQQLMPTTNIISEQKNETDQASHSNLDPHVVKYFSASQQELDKQGIKMTFNWGRPNPWPIPKFRNNLQRQSNQPK